uniref:Uncharacterized protein n=1 Tax=Oryza barthii TaxID=65489 RepID=A0A0D3HQW0_9ORYZ
MSGADLDCCFDVHQQQPASSFMEYGGYGGGYGDESKQQLMNQAAPPLSTIEKWLFDEAAAEQVADLMDLSDDTILFLQSSCGEKKLKQTPYLSATPQIRQALDQRGEADQRPSADPAKEFGQLEPWTRSFWNKHMNL